MLLDYGCGKAILYDDKNVKQCINEKNKTLKNLYINMAIRLSFDLYDPAYPKIVNYQKVNMMQ